MSDICSTRQNRSQMTEENELLHLRARIGRRIKLCSVSANEIERGVDEGGFHIHTHTHTHTLHFQLLIPESNKFHQ